MILIFIVVILSIFFVIERNIRNNLLFSDKNIKHYTIKYYIMSNIVECPELRGEFTQLIKQNANKVVIVKASASWCGPCKRSAPYFKECFNNLIISSTRHR